MGTTVKNGKGAHDTRSPDFKARDANWPLTNRCIRCRVKIAKLRTCCAKCKKV